MQPLNLNYCLHVGTGGLSVDVYEAHPSESYKGRIALGLHVCGVLAYCGAILEGPGEDGSNETPPTA